MSHDISQPFFRSHSLFCLLILTTALSACGGGGGDDNGGGSPAPGFSSGASSPSSPLPTVSACSTAAGRVLEVGPGKTYAAPSAAAAAAQSGDVIKIAAGDYRGDVASWNASNLTICGVGGRARLFADGNHAQGKGIWVVSGSNITIESIEFHNAAVPDANGAGIRAQNGGDLRIINSGFYDNENGILTNAGASSLTIENSEFARNGRGDGQTHNLYAGQIDKLTVSNSYFHEAKIGHNFKSRARESIVQNSYFMDGPTGTSSYLADFPNGGKVLLRGNMFHKGPNADNPHAIAYGLEGLSNAVNTLDVVHNTIAITRSGGAFFGIASGTSSVKFTANLFAGTGNQTLVSVFALGNVLQASNVTSLASNIPGAANIASPNFWPNTALQALISLSTVPDAAYTRDAPTPYASRAISGARKVGALQASP